MSDVQYIEKILREDEIPYFVDGDIQFYLDKNNGDVNATIYEMLIVKAEDSTVKVSGLTTTDSSKYFKRLASRYRKNQSRNM